MYTHTGKQRRHLRALAHPLKPVVQIGVQGVTQAVLDQVDTQLEIHELIKVKLGRECPVSPKEAGAALQAGPRGEVVQVVGRVVSLYRPRDEDPVIRLPQ